MNTVVKATCPDCGDVDLGPGDLELRLCSVSSRSTYRFDCPACDRMVVKSAGDGRVVRLLRSVGVPTVYWDPPAELHERHDGPPLTLDDLIDLRLALDRPDWARLIGLPSA